MNARALAVVMIAAVGSLVPLYAGAEETGRPILESRLRYEAVSQDGLSRDARALTLRTRLGYETGAWRGLRALIEGETVTALVDDYNSTVNGKIDYPVVADPESTELNRAQVAWTGERGGAVIGRQRIVLGAARFVGNVGFRQNEQTFDALRLDYRPSKDVNLTYAYVDRVLRVFGADSGQGEWDSDSHLVQIDAKTGVGQISVYGQWLDLAQAPTLSSATLGVRLAGSRPLRPGLLATYEAEYARQSEFGNSPTDFDLDYLALGAGLKSPNRWVSVGLERLDGDGRRGFQTPLATLHAYQGWADVFLNTPARGVRDLNLRAGAQLNFGSGRHPLKLSGAVHDFAEADGRADLGRELDLAASAPLSKRLSAEVKAAKFQGAGRAIPDRTKVWFTLEFKL
jgi:hypothetical protein